jgi:hypothetical protein
MLILRVALACTLLVVLTPVAASSKCGTGNTPRYSDIDAVMFTQNGCKGRILDASASRLPRNIANVSQSWFAPTFDCSTFWAFFRNNGRSDVPTTYSNFNLKKSVGLFNLSVSIDAARQLLSKDQFYDLDPGAFGITDTAWAVLSVARCGVITRIKTYNMGDKDEEQDPSTLRLFEDLRALIAGARKTMISSSPEDFAQTLLFDP